MFGGVQFFFEHHHTGLERIHHFTSDISQAQFSILENPKPRMGSNDLKSIYIYILGVEGNRCDVQLL